LLTALPPILDNETFAQVSSDTCNGEMAMPIFEWPLRGAHLP
jgi:hypothetical protein